MGHDLRYYERHDGRCRPKRLDEVVRHHPPLPEQHALQ